MDEDRRDEELPEEENFDPEDDDFDFEDDSAEDEAEPEDSPDGDDESDDEEDQEDPEDSSSSDNEESNDKKKKSELSAVVDLWNKLPFWFVRVPLGLMVFIAIVVFLAAAFEIPSSLTVIALMIPTIIIPLYKKKKAYDEEKYNIARSNSASARTKNTPIGVSHSPRKQQRVPDSVERIDPEDISVTMDDIAGNEEAKHEIQQIIEFLQDPTRFRRLGAKVPKGALLHGPPGTGKTMLAKAVAKTANVPFFTPMSSSFTEMFVGVGPKRVRELFQAAKDAAPAIIFIDEIDSAGKQRGARHDGAGQEQDNTLNEILQHMDGFANDGVDIIVIAATNRVDMLDPALMRPGRLTRHIKVDLPDIKAREDIFKVHAEGVKRRVEDDMNRLIEQKEIASDCEDEEEVARLEADIKEMRPIVKKGVFAKDVSFGSLAKMTYGCSGADIENVVNEAVIYATEANVEQVTMQEVEEAIDRVMAGTKRRNMLSPEEKRRVACHEGGHALVGYLLPDADTPFRVTIVSRDMSLGHTMAAPEKDKTLYEDKDLLAKLAVLVGGRIAEKIKYPGTKSTGSGNDYEKANQIAREMITKYGMAKDEELRRRIYAGAEDRSEAFSWSEEDKKRISDEIDMLLKEAEELAKKTLLANTELFDDFSEHLVEVESMDEDDIHDFVKSHKPKKRKEKAPNNGPVSGTQHSDPALKDNVQPTAAKRLSVGTTYPQKKDRLGGLPKAALKATKDGLKRKRKK